MRAADADILIVPGLRGSGPTHWQSRWESKLSSARRVVQTDWENPRRADWEETLARAIVECRRPAVIVAHSLGVATVLHVARHAGDEQPLPGVGRLHARSGGLHPVDADGLAHLQRSKPLQHVR